MALLFFRTDFQPGGSIVQRFRPINGRLFQGFTSHRIQPRQPDGQRSIVVIYMVSPPLFLANPRFGPTGPEAFPIGILLR